MKRIGLCVVVLGICLVGCSSSKPDLHEGEWQITAQMVMEGVPIKMPPVVYKTCLSYKDVVPGNKDVESGCKMVGPKIQGNIVSWVSTCEGPDGQVAISHGSITYAGETFAGMISVDITGDHPMAVVNTITGQYIGACE